MKATRTVRAAEPDWAQTRSVAEVADVPEAARATVSDIAAGRVRLRDLAAWLRAGRSPPPAA